MARYRARDAARARAPNQAPSSTPDCSRQRATRKRPKGANGGNMGAAEARRPRCRAPASIAERAPSALAEGLGGRARRAPPLMLRENRCATQEIAICRACQQTELCLGRSHKGPATRRPSPSGRSATDPGSRARNMFMPLQAMPRARSKRRHANRRRHAMAWAASASWSRPAGASCTSTGQAARARAAWPPRPRNAGKAQRGPERAIPWAPRRVALSRCRQPVANHCHQTATPSLGRSARNGHGNAEMATEIWKRAWGRLCSPLHTISRLVGLALRCQRTCLFPPSSTCTEVLNILVLCAGNPA